MTTISPAQFFALQRWLVAEGLSDINPVHALGTCAGLAMEVPAGTKKTLVLAIGVHLDGIVTTGLEGRYYYTRYYTSLTKFWSPRLSAPLIFAPAPRRWMPDFLPRDCPPISSSKSPTAPAAITAIRSFSTSAANRSGSSMKANIA